MYPDSRSWAGLELVQEVRAREFFLALAYILLGRFRPASGMLAEPMALQHGDSGGIAASDLLPSDWSRILRVRPMGAGVWPSSS